jgi:hypothetical protein
VDDAATEIGDALHGERQVAHLEVGERERVAGSGSANMDADLRSGRAGLPPLPLRLAAILQLDPEKL